MVPALWLVWLVWLGPLAAADPLPSDARPLAGAVIVVDPGHGGQAYSRSYTGGTRGVVSRLTESELNLRVARELAQRLRDAGAQVHLTRTADHRLSREGSSAADELHARIDWFEHHNPHFFLSVHHNAGAPEITGHTALVKHNATDVTLHEALARTINNALEGAVPGPKRSLIKGNYHLLRETDIPGTISEAGFMTNNAFDDLANRPDFPRQEAQALATGAIRYWTEHKAALVALRDQLSRQRSAKPRDPNTYTATALNPAYQREMAARLARIGPPPFEPAQVARYLERFRALEPPDAQAGFPIQAEYANSRIRLTGSVADRQLHDRWIDTLVAMKLFAIDNQIQLPARPESAPPKTKSKNRG